MGGLRALATAALYLVLKSNGLHRPKIRLKKFGFSPKTIPANIAKKLPSQLPTQSVFQLLSQTAHVCFHGRKWVHTRPSEKNRTQRLTRRNRGLPSLDHSAALRCLRNHSNQLHLQPLIPPCFYIHTFPGSLWPPTISNSSISDHLSSRFSTSRTNGPRLLSQAKAGTHSAFGERSHTRAHTAKQVAFWVGWYHYPRSVSHGSETLRGRVSERQTLPLLGLGRVYARRTQKACGTAMRLCASLFRGVAAPLGCVILLFVC